VISTSVERQLDGEAGFDWRPEGLHCRLVVPCGDRIVPQGRQLVARRPAGEGKSQLPLRLDTGNRILLVEDEVLVAMMMRDMLSEIGFAVVGPFNRLGDAMVAVVHEDIDAAIIDVNVGGELVYPVADVLVARQIPFVFLTGYGVESIERRFGFAPVIKKPVQRQVLQQVFIPPDCQQPAPLPARRSGSARDELRRTASAGGG
jgi:CheY-like chemotaxis protein